MTENSTTIPGYRVTSRQDTPAKDTTPGYLRLTPGTADLLAEVRERAVDERANCLGRWREFETPVSADRARELCGGCPIFTLCARLAERTNPVGMTQAGVWYEDEEEQA